MRAQRARDILARLGALTIFVGCATAQQNDVARCAQDALSALPRDPQQVTPYDLQDVAERLLACHSPGDAGTR